jgi:hypothetical protein
LGEGLADDVACLVGKEELRVKRDDFDCEGGALGGELGIEGFQMKEDCLFSLEHLGCALAGDGDENEMFWFHNNTMFRYLTTTLTTYSAGEQHTPAAGGSNLFNNVDHYFDDNINNLRPNQLPGALKGICGKDNSGQFEDDFFATKICFTLFATKIIKIQNYLLFLSI